MLTEVSHQRISSIEEAFEDLHRPQLLIPEHGINYSLAQEEHVGEMAEHYKAAYERGDFFASRYEDPAKQIFNPEWLKDELHNPDHLWFNFTDQNDELLGSTGFFHDYDAQTAPVMVSDETQIALPGRGFRIMDRFFKQVVPKLENAGAVIATEFLLTPESKGLRLSLQTDLGMVALGIHPHKYRHPTLDVTGSVISSAKYPDIDPQPVNILPDFEPLYTIVKDQIPSLPQPVISPADTSHTMSLGADYIESDEAVKATDLDAQEKALSDGFTPVSYDPSSNSFSVAKLPENMPDLSFIILEPNKRLVVYLSKILNVNEASHE